MDDEIDLQKYLLLIIKNWTWIAGAALILGIVAFLVSKFVLDPTYEARALAIVIQPNYSLTFDPKFSTVTETDLSFYRPVTQLAESDDLMEALRDAWQEQGGNLAYTIDDLKGMTEVDTGGTVNAVELVVTSDNPETAAQLVNIWAQLFVQQANEVFSESLEGEDTLSAEIEKFDVARTTAQQALINFEAQNQLLVFQSSLDVKQAEYTRILGDQERITRMLEDLDVLKNQISILPATQAVSFDTELAALFLQLKAYNLDNTSLQIQLDTQLPETTRTARELNAHLEQLSTVLVQKAEEISIKLEPLESEIMALQGEIKSLETTQETLQQNYQIASEAYLTLSRKLEETKITNEVSTGTVKLASGASVPLEPSGPSTLLNMVIASAVGVLGSIFFIFGIDFWKSLNETQPEMHPVRKPIKA